ncbi:MAG: hypothetical protein IT428_28220 [Planctomycetaceae bacterium]|nr:hypothetical protein [Planctomycetaceae bacterium]
MRADTLRRASIVAAVAIAAFASVDRLPQAHAQVQRFPYEATIGGDDVFIRSGPGKKYYPTGRLKSADRVLVFRHDPGGWYMIAPPAGSFSWIQADAVKPLGNRRALVTGNNVPVHVGSQIGESADVEQVKLSTNDQIQLMDDAPVVGPSGQKLYRIVPPQHEYRWILGQFVTPVDATLRKQHDKDPFGTPSTARPVAKAESEPLPRGRGMAPPEIDEAAAGFGPVARPAPKTAVRSTPVPHGSPVAGVPSAAADFPVTEAPVTQEADLFKRERQQLIDIDVSLRKTLESDISTWNLDALEASYLELSKRATNPTIARQIEPRIKTIAQHRKIKAEYDDFIRLTTETTRRDQELAQLQRGTATASATPTGDIPVAVRSPMNTTPGAPATGPSLVIGSPADEPPAPVAAEDLASVTTPMPNAPANPDAPANPLANSIIFGPPENRAIPGAPSTPAAVPAPTADPFESPIVRSPEAAPTTVGSNPVSAPPVVTTVAPSAGPMGGFAAGQVPVMANRPVGNAPFNGQSVPGQPGLGQPAIGQPGLGQPGIGQSFAPQPGVANGSVASAGVPDPTGQQPVSATVHGFSGAGIVQKMRPMGPGMPQHVLVAPSGRVLAFLQPTGNVNLDNHIGQPIGVVGPRVRRADLRGDLISVNDLSPVRLAPR